MKDHNYMASQLLVEWLNNDTMPHATRQQERNAMPRAGNCMTKVKVLLQTLEMAVLSVVRDFTVLVTASYTIVNNNIVPRRFTMDPKAKVKEKVLASLAKLVQFPKAKAKVKRTTPQIGTQTTGQNGIPTGMVPSAITIPTATMVMIGMATTTTIGKVIVMTVQVVTATMMENTTTRVNFMSKHYRQGKAKVKAKVKASVLLVKAMARIVAVTHLTTTTVAFLVSLLQYYLQRLGLHYSSTTVTTLHHMHRQQVHQVHAALHHIHLKKDFAGYHLSIAHVNMESVHYLIVIVKGNILMVVIGTAVANAVL